MSISSTACAIPFLDIREFIGLTKRSSPSKEDRQKTQRWASMLLEHPTKQFGAAQLQSIDASLASLSACHPNFSEAINWISAEMAFAHAAGQGLSFLRLLLVGSAGTGKTTFCLELAKTLALPVDVICMNNLQTSAAITGSERHWANSEPGAVLRLLSGSTMINPIIVLDEIDKVQRHGYYDPLNGFYTLLERRTAQNFSDVALPGVHFNASYINWIATANSLDDIDAPLKSRFTIFPVRKLTDGEKKEMISRMYRSLLDAHPGIDARMEPELSDEVLGRLMPLIDNGRDIDRQLRMLVGQALRDGHSSVKASHVPSEGKKTSLPIGFI